MGYIAQAIIGVKVPSRSHVACIQHGRAFKYIHVLVEVREGLLHFENVDLLPSTTSDVARLTRDVSSSILLFSEEHSFSQVAR